jgi:hypothetical protein
MVSEPGPELMGDGFHAVRNLEPARVEPRPPEIVGKPGSEL